MNRAYIAIDTRELPSVSDAELLGRLASRLPFAMEPAQRAAWEYQIGHLREVAADLPPAHFFMEFLIPRMGRRTDLIVLVGGIVFVVEYKLGARQFDRSSLDQVYGYGLDLKHFHETSHAVPIVPILVATHAEAPTDVPLHWEEDGLAKPLRVKSVGLSGAINSVCRNFAAEPIVPAAWEAGRYRPTPTIVEAAQALYRGHAVEEISRSEAGAENLNFRWEDIGWQTMQFKGTRWQAVNDTSRQGFIAHSYRVLLTRARQGMIVFVPEGSDVDETRSRSYYDCVYAFLIRSGCELLRQRGETDA